MKKILLIILKILLAVLIAVVVLFAVLTLTEYKPADLESIAIEGNSSLAVPRGKDISIMTWNIGYSALGKNNDFAMDGGSSPAADRKQVNEYFKGIQNTLAKENADINLIQEIDINSTRSFRLDMRDSLRKANGTFAYNYKCLFVPFPWPPMATINSGIYTTTDFRIDSANRKSLPCPFSWPLRVANLKRCISISYLPIEGSKQQLVVINLHLEAYSDNEARIVQLQMLVDFMKREYEKGNYVIAGGDFNQTFPGTTEKYPNNHKENWNPNEIMNSDIGNDLRLVFDSSSPTCRLLNQPYNPSDKEGTQYFVIDGFIVTPNVKVESVRAIDMNFENTDHNPVKMVFRLW